MTVRAATRGIIDFREARLHEPQWWRKCRILLWRMHEDELLELPRRAFDFQRALISHGRLEEGGFSKTQNQAQESFKKIQEQLQPWTRDKRTSDIKAQDWLKEWADAVGVDLSDPSWKEKREQYLEGRRTQLEQERASLAKETDDQRILRRKIAQEQKTKAAIAAWKKRRLRNR